MDMGMLERSLRKSAKAFGETTAQSVRRWGVSTCRKLAVETSAFGQTGTFKTQKQAIENDAKKVLHVYPDEFGNNTGIITAKNKKLLLSAEAVNDWIELNRTGRNGRTPKKGLPSEERKCCKATTFRSAMRIRFKHAGMAKGGWLGAGMEIAREVGGGYKDVIGKNFMSYAQKFSHMGRRQNPNRDGNRSQI